MKTYTNRRGRHNQKMPAALRRRKVPVWATLAALPLLAAVLAAERALELYVGAKRLVSGRGRQN